MTSYPNSNTLRTMKVRPAPPDASHAIPRSGRALLAHCQTRLEAAIRRASGRRGLRADPLRLIAATPAAPAQIGGTPLHNLSILRLRGRRSVTWPPSRLCTQTCLQGAAEGSSGATTALGGA